MRVKSTVYPPTRLDQNEWMEYYRVSSRVPKYDGLCRARNMMMEYDSLENRSLIKRIAQNINPNKYHEEDQLDDSVKSRLNYRIR